MDDDGQDQPHGVDNDVAFPPVDLLAGIVTAKPPFSLVLTLWLSMMAALGVAFLLAFSRTRSRRRV